MSGPGTRSLPRFEPAGIDGWIIRLFDEIDESNIGPVQSLAGTCEKVLGDALIDLVPSYTTLLVIFDPLRLAPWEARALLIQCVAESSGATDREQGALHTLETWYDPSVGPDLERVAQHANVTVDDVIARHSGLEYRVFAIGFAPGFAFMGLLDPVLECPRHDTPRRSVPAGSVAITGRQTAAYPMATPGGWNLLGRTATRLFDRERKPFNLLRAGDRVRFVAVDHDAFAAAGGDDTPMERS